MTKSLAPCRRGVPVADRFTDFWIPEPNSGCWLWIGGLRGGGYGVFRRQQAHRFSWQLYKGEIPDGMLVCHRCDTPACVNPDHLFIGTNSDNQNDMVRKGRDTTRPRGEAHPKARFTEDEVLQIRGDDRPLREIAKEYGVDKQHIWKIKRGWYWSHSHWMVDVDDAEARRARGKMICARGERHGRAKLTENDVRVILLDKRSSNQLAQIYPVSRTTIKAIRRRQIWKNITCA